MNIIRYDVKIPVTVRKHEVNIKELQNLLREAKKTLMLSNKQIGQALDRPITEVEHWFRTDKCFSIPQPSLWYELKNLLNIQTDIFDAPVMEFVTVDGVYDQANRIYDVEGISPTLTVASEVLILEPVKHRSRRAQKMEQMTIFDFMEERPKVNSFFCGAGGFDLGFIQAGFEIVGAWDFDKYAVESYNHNTGGAKQADVSQMKGSDISKSNGWLFGFPCQDISVAGKQAGMIKGETRSGLFYEIMRLLGEVSDKPEWILAENVKAVNKFIPTIEEEYDKAGYTLVSPQLYNSKYWGVPQNRERYFLLGIRKDLSKSFVFPQQQTDFIPKLSSILEENVDEKYYIDDLKAAKIIEQAMEGLKVRQATKKGYDIAVEGDSINISHPNSKTRRGRVGKQVAQTLLTGTEQVVVERDIVVAANLNHYGNDQMNRVYDTEGVSPTALVVSGGGREIKILEEIQSVFTDKDGAAYCCDANYAKGTSPGDVGKGRRTHIVALTERRTEEAKQIRKEYREKYGKDFSPRRGKEIVPREDEVANCCTATVGIEQQVLEIPQFRVRKLTPREYARLQGFPESYEQIVSNSQFYKQMGNAVTVNVAHAIATAIKEQL